MTSHDHHDAPVTLSTAHRRQMRKPVPYFHTETSVDVTIDPDDLRRAGWHHQNECDEVQVVNEYGATVPAGVPLIEAVDSLHRQAHPSQHPSLRMCHEEPCRSLTLAQLRCAP